MQSNSNLNAAIEIHDSSLERIELEGAHLIVVPDAYVHRSEGEPGVHAGSGWSQVVHLRFLAGAAQGIPDALPARCWDGHVESAEGKFENIIPVPFQCSSPVELHLKLGSGGNLVVVGQALDVQLVGEAKYVEQFPGLPLPFGATQGVT